MRVETRKFEQPDGSVEQHLLLIVETNYESIQIDKVMGAHVGEDGLIAKVAGEVKLADGFGAHYIRLVPAGDTT